MRTASTALTLALLTAGCASSIPPVEVTRFHLNGQIARAPIAPAVTTGGNVSGLERSTYDAAVARELAQAGFAPARDFVGARYNYSLEVTRDSREALARRSPISIGIGGGSFGGGFGGGIGANFGIGGNRSRTTVITQLAVRITERGGSTVWEGRAETEAPSNAPAAQPGLAAEKLARALFQGFPGESGRTIRVR